MKAATLIPFMGKRLRAFDCPSQPAGSPWPALAGAPHVLLPPLRAPMADVVRPAAPAPPVEAPPRPSPPGLDLVPVNGIRIARAFIPYVQRLRDCAARGGYTFRLTSGYRSPEDQRQLSLRWAAGDPDVVAPPAANSLHLLGLAVDVESNNLTALGRCAEASGMRWGGRFGDPVHFDLGRG
jgi:hypothetical protein